MKCPKCGSERVTVSVINEVHLVDRHHRLVWWILVGWWWIAIKWLFLTLPALIVKLFGRRKQTTRNTKVKICVCQNCGNAWKIR
jgi:hypothetical protein